MLTGAVLGAIIVLLLLAVVFLFGQNRALRKMVLPVMKDNNKLLDDNVKLMDENSKLKRPEYVVGFSDQQIESLAAHINRSIRQQSDMALPYHKM